MRLAESVWQLTDPKLPAERRKAEYYEAAFDTLKKMAETSNSMRGEVQTLWASPVLEWLLSRRITFGLQPFSMA